LARTDRAIGSITGDELRLIAAVLDRVGRSWLARRLMPRDVRDKALACTMIAATLARTPAERQPSLQEQIRLQMLKGKEA
jgi:hypothetical protein